MTISFSSSFKDNSSSSSTEGVNLSIKSIRTSRIGNRGPGGVVVITLNAFQTIPHIFLDV